jgi:uncharacterized protein (DUF433 family)
MSTATQLDAVRTHIARMPGVCGGKPCVAGTRIRVWDVVVMNEHGASPDEILAAYPGITLADVHAALAYYFDNREEIERQIADDAAFAAQLKAKTEGGRI